MGSCSACFVGSPHPDPDDNGGCFFFPFRKKKGLLLISSIRVYPVMHRSVMCAALVSSCAMP
jgi:hypothetical protein